MSGKAPFGVAVGLCALAIAAVATSAVAIEKSQKHVVILPRAGGPAERLQPHPRVPVEVVPLSGSVPPSTAADPSSHRGAVTARACAGSKVTRAECAEMAMRIDRFMSEQRSRATANTPPAADLCGKGRQSASRCASFVAQIDAWLKTRQTAEAPPPPALAGSTTNDR
jgi:hypothetical protein